jgi:TonB family protein
MNASEKALTLIQRFFGEHVLENRLGLIGVALGGTSLVISAVTALMVTVGTGSEVAALKKEVAALRGQTQTTSDRGNDNARRISELDYGLTAMVKVQGVNLFELEKAIRAQKASAAPSPITQAAATASRSTVAPTQAAQPANSNPAVPAVAAVAALGNEATRQTQPKPAPAPESSKPKVQDAQPGDNPFTQAAPPTGAAAPEAPVDNPFNSAKDEASQAAPLAIKAEPYTIERVDAVLGKRLSESWFKPAGNLTKLKAIVEMKVGRDGHIANVRVVQSSGSKPFDVSALNAIKGLGRIEEVALLSEADYLKAYAKRSIEFTPDMGH